MSNLFNKLPGFKQSPPGREREVLLRLPRLLVLGSVVPCVPSLFVRMWPWEGSAVAIATRITTVDIYAVSVIVLHWTVVLTVAIVALIVMVMKGPAYVADAYPLSDAEYPDAAGPR